MKGIIVKVFLVIGVLVICLVGWGLIMGDDGILAKGWNKVTSEVDESFEQITGESSGIADNTWTDDSNLDNAQSNANN